MKLNDLVMDAQYNIRALEIRAWPALYRENGAVELLGFLRTNNLAENGKSESFFLELSCVPCKDWGVQRTSPMCVLDAQAAQALLESLWAAGIRPRGEASAGQLAAVEKHLADMRQLAFATLDVQKP